MNIISSIGNYIIGRIVDEVLEAETSSKEPDKPTKITRLKHKIMVGPDIAPTQDANTQEPWQIHQTKSTVPKGDQQPFYMEVLDSNEVERGKSLRKSDLDMIDVPNKDEPEERWLPEQDTDVDITHMVDLEVDQNI